MRIKRTYGATMREALAQVKQEQGADAVILGNKKVPGGVEILSAIDFDHRDVDAYTGNPSTSVSESMIEQLAENDNSGNVQLETHVAPRVAAPATIPDFIFDQSEEGRKEPVLGMQSTEAMPQIQTNNVQPMPRPAAKKAVKPTPRKAKVRSIAKPEKQKQSVTRTPNKNAKKGLPVEEEALVRATQADKLLHSLRENQYGQQPAQFTDSNPVIDEVKDELKNLRDLMQSQLSVLEWDRFSQRHPVRSVLLNLMAEVGLGSDVCEMVFSKLGELNENPHKVWQKALGILATAIPIAKNDILAEGGRIALVGSTGVGKTTTIAKLAARFVNSHGKRSVALVSTDNFRIGAQEQLQHFARMLEIPLLTANNSEELTDRLKMLADKHLVLIDTAGMSQTDVRLSEQFHKLQHGSPEIQPYLVLSANTQMAAINETIKSFERVKLAGGIVTKIDESASLGGVITAAIRHQLPLSYCGTGQRVPEDLQMAKNHRLVSKAVSLMQNHTEQVNKETLAFRYSNLTSNKHN